MFGSTAAHSTKPAIVAVRHCGLWMGNCASALIAPSRSEQAVSPVLLVNVLRTMHDALMVA